jgi:hypothetical protein
VITPHPDVATGRYAVAEFAADLAQVRRGDAGPEYGDAPEFFRRTFLTAGLSRLLVGAMQRLAGRGGDPVIERRRISAAARRTRCCPSIIWPGTASRKSLFPPADV